MAEVRKFLSVFLAILVIAASLASFSALAEEELYEIEVMTDSADWDLSTDTKVGQYIADEFGIVFKNIYYAGDIREKQSMNLAAGEIGEIVYMQRNDMVSAYYNAGVLLCLEDCLAQMPNFTERFEAQLERWRQPTGGKLYKWETNTPNTIYESCEVAIRSDILELCDWKMPTTVSELIDLLKKAKEAYPTTVDGMMTVGMTVPFAESYGLQGIACIGYEKGGKYLSIGNEGVVFNWVEDRFEDYFLIPETKESLKMFHTMYQEGILDVESFTDFCDQTQGKMATGQALAVWYTTWLATVPNQELHAAGLDDYQYVSCFIQLDSQAEAGEPRSFKIETARPFDSWAISTSCRYPERVIELLDWASSDEGQVLLQCGFEGETYTVDADGKRVPTEALLNSTREDRIAWGIDGLFEFLPRDVSQNSSDGQYFYLPNEPIYKDQVTCTERQREVYNKMGFDYSTQWGDEHGVFVDTGSSGSVVLDATSEFSKIQQQMVDCRVKWSAQLIMAESDEEFESVWAEAMAEYDLLDHQSVVDEYNRLYQEIK